MTTAEQLADRYGRTTSRSRRILWWTLVAVGAVAAVATLTWSTFMQSSNQVQADDLAMRVVDEHEVTVTFQVTGQINRDMACALEALDESFGVVGWKIIELPATPSHAQQLTETIPTIAEATTGLVNSCWLT